jgi:hypothetical protein
VPTTLKPGGSFVTRSPWLIQTWRGAALPHAVEQLALAVTSITARPNSR